jgi:DNA polymerase elongation subunit (family B)
MKEYGKRIRLSPSEVGMVLNYRGGGKYKPMSEIPKILVFDIETAFLTSALWGLRTNYVDPSMLLESKNYWMLSWSAKWLFSPEILNDVCTGEEAMAENDRRISASLWKLMDEADIVISHNGKNFDHKRANARWLIHGFNPPSPYKIIDTLAICRKMFSFPSYKLDYLAEVLGIGNKMPNGKIDRWKKCMLGDEESLSAMSEYNDHDVKILEDLYLILRPWIPNHPNLGLFIESDNRVCATCGGEHLNYYGDYITNVSRFESFQCVNCGAISRQRQSVIPKRIRKAMLSPVEMIR